MSLLLYPAAINSFTACSALAREQKMQKPLYSFRPW